MARDTSVDPIASMIGQTFGNYTITSLLGHGGMSTVFSAKQANLDRVVALKVLPPDRGRDRRHIERFVAEARTAARLDHPNVIPIYDVGEDHGVAFIAMRLIDGPTLAEVIPQAGLPLERVDAIIRQLASALDYVHRQGLIHRDVKAGNVMVEAGDKVTLTDFGIAGTRAQIESAGATIEGTAEYLAPELARGLPATARSDIYALGVLTYELVAGHVPFMGNDAHTILRQHISAQPMPLGRVREDIPNRLEQAVHVALWKTPSNRFSSAGSFARSVHVAIAERDGTSASRTDVHDAPTQVLPQIDEPDVVAPTTMTGKRRLPAGFSGRRSRPPIKREPAADRVSVLSSVPPPIDRRKMARPRRRVLLPVILFGLAMIFVFVLGSVVAYVAWDYVSGLSVIPSVANALHSTPALPRPAQSVSPPTVTPPKSGARATSTAETPRPVAATPRDAIQGYYNALLRKDYHLAYGYWSDARRAAINEQTGLTMPEGLIRSFTFRYPAIAERAGIATAVITRGMQVADAQQTVTETWDLVRQSDGNWRLDKLRVSAP